jgi:hypothetical protein
VTERMAEGRRNRGEAGGEADDEGELTNLHGLLEDGNETFLFVELN